MTAGWWTVAMAAPAPILRSVEHQGHYGHWGINLVVVVATALAVGACVLLHYEGLTLLSRSLARMSSRGRRRVLRGIFGVLALHVAEIWLFALVLYALLQIDPLFGQIHGIPAGSVLDQVYFSAVTYSTVGFGDVIPTGPIRFLTGTEALTGFVLITWSASFTFLEMERFWRRD